MAATAILDFQILKILINVGTLNIAKLRQCAKFCRNRSNRIRDMVIFRFYKMAVAAMLDFQIFVNYNNRNAQEGQTASSCQISSNGHM